MIERTIHRVWLGPKPIPRESEGFWREFERLHPGWDLRTWREDDLDWLVNRAEFDASRSFSERSDVARFEILAKDGGIYVDTDVQPLRSLEFFRSLGPFAGYESPRKLCGAVMGSPAGHPATLALVDQLPRWVRMHRDKPAHIRTGPAFLTKVWGARDDVVRVSPEVFYPVGWWERDKLGGPYPPESFTTHWWNKSWGESWDPAVV